jgi:hypothetical protein
MRTLRVIATGLAIGLAGCATGMPPRPDQPRYFTANDLQTAKREQVGGQIQTVGFEAVPHATIELRRNGRLLATATTDGGGRFAFPGTYSWGAGYSVQLVSDAFTAGLSFEIADQRASHLQVLAAERSAD